MNKMLNPWDKNVSYRINELEFRIDKTYWELLVPLFIKEINNITPNKRIIDVGCGLGFLTHEIASRVDKITGIDTSFRSIEYAKSRFDEKCGIEFKNISIIDFQRKYHDIRYDICIANMVFHNISNLDQNLNAISKLLINNGYLIFSVPHPAFWYASRKFKEKDKAFNYSIEKEYFVPFKIKNRKKHPYLIKYFHRSEQQYYELLKKNNFKSEDLKEPFLHSNSQSKTCISDIYFCVYRLA